MEEEITTLRGGYIQRFRCPTCFRESLSADTIGRMHGLVRRTLTEACMETCWMCKAGIEMTVEARSDHKYFHLKKGGYMEECKSAKIRKLMEKQHESAGRNS